MLLEVFSKYISSFPVSHLILLDSIESKYAFNFKIEISKEITYYLQIRVWECMSKNSQLGL